MGFILIPILLLVIAFKYKDNKIKKDPLYLKVVDECLSFLNHIDNFKKDYFTYSNKKFLHDKYKDTYNNIKSSKAFSRFKDESISKFMGIYPNLENLVPSWNDRYIESELKVNEGFFNDIDGKSLDEQQRKAVIVDEDNNLVVASAGARVIIVTGCINTLISKVSGTFIKNNSCIA